MRDNTDLRLKLQSGIKELGLDIPDQGVDKFIQYIELLRKWNKVFNLTAITDSQAIVTHHILDSLSIVPYINGSRLLDIGSGAGFPGLPCAIAKPELNVVLLDSNGKKTRFLTQAAAELKISNVKVIQSRIEDYQDTCFDTITARAFSSVENIVKQTRRLLCSRGELLIMKGTYPQAELQSVTNHAKVHSLSVPYLDEKRHIVCIKVD